MNLTVSTMQTFMGGEDQSSDVQSLNVVMIKVEEPHITICSHVSLILTILVFISFLQV